VTDELETESITTDEVYDEDLYDEEPEEKPVSFGRWLAELLVMVALAFLLASGIRTFVVQPYVRPQRRFRRGRQRHA